MHMLVAPSKELLAQQQREASGDGGKPQGDTGDSDEAAA
jgi:hypothetical protein